MKARDLGRVSLSPLEETRGSLSGGPWPDQDPARDFPDDPSAAELEQCRVDLRAAA